MDLQHSLERFLLHTTKPEWKSGLYKTEILRFSWDPRQCMLDVSDNELQHMEMSKYLGVVITGDGRQNKEIDTRIAKANAVLRELYHSVLTKREL